jgi:hypothetical protein
MKNIKLPLLLVFFTLLSQTASASQIQIIGQVLPLNQGLPNQDSYHFTSTDGTLTSLQYDSGLLSGNRGGTARSAASVDIQQGALRVYTEINGAELASARASLSDGVFFDLPDGVDSAEVTLNLEVEGSFSGTISTCRTCFGGRLGFGNGIAPNSAPDQHVINIERDFEATGLPTLLSITRTVVEGARISVTANIQVGSNLWSLNDSSLFMLADLSNTGVLSLDLPEGVTFTSESGSFLSVTNVPLPAAAWLFGSALLGLGALKRKKA